LSDSLKKCTANLTSMNLFSLAPFSTLQHALKYILLYHPIYWFAEIQLLREIKMFHSKMRKNYPFFPNSCALETTLGL
jgi:hypothetical protein